MTNLIQGKLYTFCSLFTKHLTAYGYNESNPETLTQYIVLDANSIFVYLYTKDMARGGRKKRNHYFILVESKIYTICFYGDETVRLEQNVRKIL